MRKKDDSELDYRPAAAWWRWLNVAAGLVVLGLALSRGRGPFPPFAKEHPIWILVCLALAFFITAVPSVSRRVRAIVLETPRRLFLAGVFVAAVCLYAWVCWAVFDGVPRLDDDVAALFQARLFAVGKLDLPLPEKAEFFKLFALLGGQNGIDRVISMYPPGWSMLLTPGVWLGIPWLITPLLGGCLVVLIAMTARAMYGDRVERVAALFGLTSPFVATLAGTHLSHVPTAAFLMLCLWATVRLIRAGRSVHGWLAGGAWGIAMLCRPLTALVVGAAIALWPLCHFKAALRAWKGVVIAGLVACFSVGILLSWQFISTGDPHTPGHKVGMGARGKFGFVKLDSARTHTPAIGFDYTLKRMRVVNDDLLGWPIPSLAIVLLPFLFGRARGRDWWLIVPWLALLATYWAYWYWEEFFPARYTFSGIPMLLALAAGGYGELEKRWPKRWAAARVPAAIVPIAGVLFSALVAMPAVFGRFGPNHGDVECALPRIMKECDIHHAVVFMDAAGAVPTDGDAINDFYATGFMRNDLDLQGDIVYARNLRADNMQLMRLYWGRKFYRYCYLRGTSEGRLIELLPTPDGMKTRTVYEPGEGK